MAKNKRPQPGEQHICPLEKAHSLDTWFRKFVHSPKRILGEYVREGDMVLDLGCGPGFFTLPITEMTGASGMTIGVDVQQGMLDMVRAKAAKKGLTEQRIGFHQCESDRIGLSLQADFILAYYMVHETPDKKRFFEEVRTLLKPGGKMLVVEPPFHVNKTDFAQMVDIAKEAGLNPLDFPKKKGGLAVVLGV